MASSPAMMASASAWSSGDILKSKKNHFLFQKVKKIILAQIKKTVSFPKKKQSHVFCSLLSCDQTSNCIDESDEDNCKLLSMKVGINSNFLFSKDNFCIYICLPKDNYNKKIAPFSFDKVLKAVIPVNINVSMSVIDILKIEEVDHIYVLKFRLVLEWCVDVILVNRNSLLW